MARDLTANFGEAITGIGYQLKSSTGSNIGSRVTSGIVNVATGVYRAAGVSEGSAVGVFWDGTTSTGRTVSAYESIDLAPVNAVKIAGQTANASAAVTFPAAIVGTANLPANFSALQITAGDGLVSVGTNYDKNEYYLAGGQYMYLDPDYQPVLVDAIWNESRTGHTTAGTFGFYLDAQVSGVSGGGGGSGPSVEDIWGYSDRTLTDKTGFELSVTERADLTVNIASAVWNEAKSAHNTVGTFGYYLDARVSLIPTTAGATAAQVWSYAGAGGRALTDKTGFTLASGEYTSIRNATWNTTDGTRALTVTIPTAVQIRQEIDSNSTQLAAILASALKSQAAVYDSASVAGSVITLSNGKTQNITNSGRITSA